MMQNRMDQIFWGRPFKNTSDFNLRTSEFQVLGPGSLTWDLGTRILIPKLYILPRTNRTCLPPKDWYMFAVKRWVYVCRKKIDTKILLPRSLGEPAQGDGGTALSRYPNRYAFLTVRTPQASLVGEQSASKNLPAARAKAFSINNYVAC